MEGSQNLADNHRVKRTNERKTRNVHQFFQSKKNLRHKLGGGAVEIINKNDNALVAEFGSHSL